MKKLVYILSLAIGLILTGCAKWENFESLSPDTWGAEPVLEVTAPDSIKTEVISFTIKTVNATNIAYMVTASPATNIDYTILLQGMYQGSNGGEVDPEGFEQTFSLKGAVPGNTYYLYVVAANAAGVQATYEKAMGAHDLDAPYLTSDPALKATNKGYRATLTFNEAIVRSDVMGAITYDIYDENYEVVGEGTATAVANGNQLVVTLPSTVTFDAISFVLLSFEQGAVEDKFGNKMAAIDNYLEDGLPNGPWWMVDPNASEGPTEGFFKDGHGYAFVGRIDLGNGMQDFGGPVMPLTYVASDVALGEDIVATQWSMPSILNMFGEESISSGLVTPNEAVSAFTYSAQVEGGNTEIISFFDMTTGYPVLGTMALGQNGELYEVYAADYNAAAGQVNPGWDFAVFTFEGQGKTFDGCAFIGTAPVIIVIDGNQAQMVAEIDPETFQFHDGDLFSVSYGINVLDEPVVLENVNLEVNRNKVFNYAK